MTDKAHTAQGPAKGDERNVVAVDAGAPEATVEERLARFWLEHRTTVIAAIVVIVLAIVGRAAWDSYVAGRERGVREAFGAATTADAQLAFARENPNHPLAGLALLSAADGTYAGGDFSQATQRYNDAAAVLAEPALKARARLGAAVSQVQGGQNSTGEAALREIAQDEAAPAAIRCEAYFHLAAIALDVGNAAVAVEALNKIDETDPTGLWARRAVALRAQVPAITGAN